MGGAVDLVFNANMIHIAPIAVCHGLFRGAGRVLGEGGILMTYGPYAVHGVLAPQSNVDFDASLKSRNSEWGIRDIDLCEEIAREHGLALSETYDVPANNKILVWRKGQVASQ